MTATLLVDLGGTRVKAALLTAASGAQTSGAGMHGEVVVRPHGGDWRSALTSAVHELGADEVALSVPGLVATRRVVSLPGKLPGLEGADLTSALGVPVCLVVNDAIAYGVGEAVHGAGRGHDRVVVVTLGTGIGVAVVEDGSPLGRGPLGGGVLGGQLPLGAAEGGVDTSGRTGTFEALCRADSLVAAVPGAADTAAAYALLASGDPAAAQGFSTYRQWLVHGLTALCLAHAPTCVVVGGGAAQAPLLEGVQAAVQDGLWPGQSVSVRLAGLGDAAALVGLGALLSRSVPV